jgi:uncharacterized protein YggE
MLASMMGIVLLAIAACGGSAQTPAAVVQGQAPSGEPRGGAQVEAASPSSGGPRVGAPAGVAPSAGAASFAAEGAAARGLSGIAYGSSQQLGIFVTAIGEVTTAPDLVVLNAGVEAQGDTVKDAQADAAEAMDRVMGVLKARNVEDRDIQTRSFSISPEYTYNERLRRQELVGYIVRNQLVVRLRDVAGVGPVIDEVAAAGGDLVRVEGVSFTVEDTEELESEAREKALVALTAKAQQFARLTGVQLGKPVFLSESGGFIPVVQTMEARALAEGPVAAKATSISGGELTVSITVQGTFSIVE